MKYIMPFIFFFLFVSCKDCIKRNESKVIDKRCEKLDDEAYKKGVETGVCYNIPEDGPVMTAAQVEQLDPDPEACKALFADARAKCRALPPAGPGDIKQVSGSSFSGRPVCD